MSTPEEIAEQRAYMLNLAHWNNATFLAIAAARFMNIDWRHVPTLTVMLEGREGRTLGPECPEDDIFFSANEAAKAIRAACQSPIEELFVGRISLASDRGTHLRLNMNLRTSWEPKIMHWEIDDGTVVATLYQQLQIEKFRLDFALVTPSAKVAIELDGHDFHERTKQQATRDKSRDRRLTELGWKVLRFTGSEVWADAMLCADQAWGIATK